MVFVSSDDPMEASVVAGAGPSSAKVRRVSDHSDGEHSNCDM